jgi:hypothetical protein
LAFHSGREADHSPPSSAEVKEWVELYLHSPNTPSWRGAQLGGAQGAQWLLKKIVCNPKQKCPCRYIEKNTVNDELIEMRN